MFQLNWFNIAIATTGRHGLRCFLMFLEKSGKCKYLHFSKHPLGYIGKEKPVKWVKDCWVHIFLVEIFILYKYMKHMAVLQNGHSEEGQMGQFPSAPHCL